MRSKPVLEAPQIYRMESFAVTVNDSQTLAIVANSDDCRESATLGVTQAAPRGILSEKVFLEISQNSSEKTCALAQVFSCEFCVISKYTFFYRTPLGDCFQDYYSCLLRSKKYQYFVFLHLGHFLREQSLQAASIKPKNFRVYFFQTKKFTFNWHNVFFVKSPRMKRKNRQDYLT